MRRAVACALAMAVLLVAVLTSGGRARAQSFGGLGARGGCRSMNAISVVLETTDPARAERVRGVLSAIHGRASVVPCAGRSCVSTFLPGEGADSRRHPIPSTRHALEVVYGDQRHQAVTELEVHEADGAGVVRVRTDVDAAILVVTGEGAESVHDFGHRTAPWAMVPTSGEGWAVRALGAQRGEPLEIAVPVGARASLVTCWVPIHLEIRRDGDVLHVDGVPPDEGLVLRAQIDLRPVEHRETHGFDRREIVVPEELAVGRHTLRAELVDEENGEVVSWVEGHFHRHAHTPIDLTAGLAEQCVVLHDGAVARRRTVEAIGDYSLLRARIDTVQVGGDYVRGGSEVCFWAPWWAGEQPRRELWLANTPSEVNAVVELRVERLPYWLLGLALLGFVLASIAVLAWGLWPREAAPVSHVAWSLDREGGYRDRDTAPWTVAPLPFEPTALAELDERLAPYASTVHRREDERAEIEPAGPVVIAPAGATPTVQLSRTVLRRGAAVIDGELRLVMLDADAAARVATGDQPPLPAREDVQRAREIGFTTELVVPPRPRRAARAVWIVAWTGVATLMTFAPAVLGQLVPSVRRFTDPAGSWIVMAVMLLVLMAATVSRAREQDRALDA